MVDCWWGILVGLNEKWEYGDGIRNGIFLVQTELINQESMG
jgi:hypothetical protein